MLMCLEVHLHSTRQGERSALQMLFFFSGALGKQFYYF